MIVVYLVVYLHALLGCLGEEHNSTENRELLLFDSLMLSGTPLNPVGGQGDNGTPLNHVGHQGDNGTPLDPVGHQADSSTPLNPVGHQADSSTPLNPVGHQGDIGTPLNHVGGQGDNGTPLNHEGHQADSSTPLNPVGHQGDIGTPLNHVEGQGDNGTPLNHVGGQGDNGTPLNHVGHQADSSTPLNHVGGQGDNGTPLNRVAGGQADNGTPLNHVGGQDDNGTPLNHVVGQGDSSTPLNPAGRQGDNGTPLNPVGRQADKQAENQHSNSPVIPTHDLNMTIYLIKYKNALKPTNTSSNTPETLHNNTIPLATNAQESNHQTPTSLQTSTKNKNRDFSSNTTVYVDVPENAEPLPDLSTSSLTNATNIESSEVQSTLQNNWSWNQRTGRRWPSRSRYRRQGSRYRSRYRRPSVRRPSGGGGGGGGRPTGGSPTGGSPTGGSPTGGSPTGGSPTGGSPTGGSPSPSTGGSGSGGFEQEGLQAHNNFRSVHNAPAMTLNNELNQQAKAYAKKIADLGALQHSSNKERGEGIGENLAMGCSSFGDPLSAKQAVTNWYNEVCLYSFNNPGFSMDTGHFTQVVWQDSTELGIGKATGKKGSMPCVYVVGRYRTAGNFNNMFKEKVLKGSFQKSYCNNVNKGKK